MQDIEKVTSFVSIDFETVRGTSSANGGRYAHLPCAVGICLVLNGVIVQKIHGTPDFGTYIGNGKDDEVGIPILRKLEFALRKSIEAIDQVIKSLINGIK